MKYSTIKLSPSKLPHFFLLPGFEPVAGLRVLGHSPVHWLHDQLDKTGRLEIGRVRGRGIQLEDKSVSCCHAEIQRVEAGVYILRDLGSRNGVKVRERGHQGVWIKQPKGTSVILQPGIHIKLGDVIVVPVDIEGRCPINARDHIEFARAAEETYGSAAAASSIVGRSRHWIRSLAQKIGQILL